MRYYDFTAERPGGYMFWPPKDVSTTMRVGQAAIVVFKKWFGHLPTGHWHENGFMAEAWDKRGNRVTLEQINNKDQRYIKENAA